MGMFAYLILGAVMYVSGFLIRQKIVKPKLIKLNKTTRLSPTDPIVIQWVVPCFVVMLVVSAVIGRFLLEHQGFDFAYIIINSLVATVVFYFGFNPDESTMKLPD